MLDRFKGQLLKNGAVSRPTQEKGGVACGSYDLAGTIVVVLLIGEQCFP